MCGRFVQRDTWDEIQDLYELPDGPAGHFRRRRMRVISPLRNVIVCPPYAGPSDATAMVQGASWG
jgi:hypothetical protein